MRTLDFDYELPRELIAQEPPETRGTSRMMVLHRNGECIEHRHVNDLPDYLTADDLIVLNDTRVFPARLNGRWTDSGGGVELLLVDPLPVPEWAEKGIGVACWACFCGAKRHATAGLRAQFGGGEIDAEILGQLANGMYMVLFRTLAPLMAVLEKHGRTPVPPYVRRDKKGDERMERLDRERYQTIYARETGAIAAPTAGLHFTDALFRALDTKGVRRASVTLHVGPGTFKPVKAREVEDHRMTPERYSVVQTTADALAACQARGGRVVAVGSTTVRTLETVAAANGGRMVASSGASSIFIYPPYPFLATDAMLTNFHIPRSTLLMMVSALAGREFILRAYQVAIAERYRFFSYGDCMLIL
ncbi:MAG: tRNA preQ1(34) S-adenosylmethionine ribosyltransferase-isomerase QueA [Kiritimatiellaeota bacterium]|nr:tRNA preQ1(34) S-adenosylmethionine ribosyltransferase-isomerase QueA [Kiritimatiellota bacterium]